VSKVRLKNLLQSIGGEDRLREILRDFYHRMSEDILIGYFFTGKDLNSIADRQSDFLIYAMGASTTYQGKLPTSAHLELPPILKGHFDRRLVILRQTLKDHGLRDPDIQNWIDFESAFREVVQSSSK